MGLIVALCATPAHAACFKHVFVFDAYWCGFCKQTKNFLHRHGIPFEAVEITNNHHFQSLLTTNFGSAAVPVTIIDGRWNGTQLTSGTVIVGFQEAALRSALCIP